MILEADRPLRRLQADAVELDERLLTFEPLQHLVEIPRGEGRGGGARVDVLREKVDPHAGERRPNVALTYDGRDAGRGTSAGGRADGRWRHVVPVKRRARVDQGPALRVGPPEEVGEDHHLHPHRERVVQRILVFGPLPQRETADDPPGLAVLVFRADAERWYASLRGAGYRRLMLVAGTGIFLSEVRQDWEGYQDKLAEANEYAVVNLSKL